MTAKELASYIDHTLLKPNAVDKQFDQLCEEAVHYGFKSVCVNSSRVPYVVEKLKGKNVLICTVVGFPLGAMDTESKAFEARTAVINGAQEVDMVINIGEMLNGNHSFVEKDIRTVKAACGKDIVLKVIIETSYLNNEQIIEACKAAKNAGADFVKTSTGFSSAGAVEEHVALMRQTVGADMGVKASGGISTWEKALAMINAGANRLGLGASVAVVTGAPTDEKY